MAITHPLTKDETRTAWDWYLRFHDLVSFEFSRAACAKGILPQDQKDALNELIAEYLIARFGNLLRYMEGKQIRQPQGVYRTWVRQMIRWYLRDRPRQSHRRAAALEVRVAADGQDRRDGIRVAFDRLANPVGESEEASEAEVDVEARREHAQEVVSVLYGYLEDGDRKVVACFLAAAEGRMKTETKGMETRLAKRLSGLREEATRALQEVDAA